TPPWQKRTKCSLTILVPLLISAYTAGKALSPVRRNVVEQLLNTRPLAPFRRFSPPRVFLVGGGVRKDFQLVIEDDYALLVRFAHVRSFTPSRLVEDGVAGAAPLEFKEPVGSRDQQNAVPQPTGGLASRGGGHNGAEEGDVLDRDDGSAHFLADPVHAVMVRLAQCLIVVGALRGFDEIRWLSHVGECRRDGLQGARLPAVVQPRPQSGVEASQFLVARALLHCDGYPHPPPRLGGEHLPVLLRHILALVEDSEAHDMPARADRAHLLHLEQPARRDPRPRAERVEPQVHRNALLCHRRLLALLVNSPGVNLKTPSSSGMNHSRRFRIPHPGMAGSELIIRRWLSVRSP